MAYSGCLISYLYVVRTRVSSCCVETGVVIPDHRIGVKVVVCAVGLGSKGDAGEGVRISFSKVQLSRYDLLLFTHP